MGTYRTSHPIIKLYSLEVRSEEHIIKAVPDDCCTKYLKDKSFVVFMIYSMSACVSANCLCSNTNKSTEHPEDGANDTSPPTIRPQRKAAAKASQRMSQWATTMSSAPEDIED